MGPIEHRGEHIGLSSEEKSLLLRIARDAIENRLSGQETALPEISSQVLRERRGVFVTLHKGGALRGCIGYIQGVKPLYQAVSEMALSAAFGDPRFPPLSAHEVPKVVLEISVLTPLRRVRDISEIQVGQHGIYILQGSYSGLLLPQVATEYGWDRDRFLHQTCLKAGLPPTAWRDPNTEIYIFRADIFGEKDAQPLSQAGG